MNREREAFRQIGAALSDCIVKKRKPTVDEMYAMLSWALAGLEHADRRLSGGGSVENGTGGEKDVTIQ